MELLAHASYGFGGQKHNQSFRTSARSAQFCGLLDSLGPPGPHAPHTVKVDFLLLR